jgi:hypothetical protein
MAATVMVMNLKNRGGGGNAVAAAPSAEEAAASAEAAKQAAQEAADREAYFEKHPCARRVDQLLDILNSNTLQTILYLVFVLIFQSLTNTIRKPEEFYVDKLVMDRIVENHFDSSHNTLESVRRTADIYEWGNTVLWPGLFSDLGPCDGNVGMDGVAKGCNDETWPDGDGSFHGGDATAFSITELVELTDRFDWTEGLLIRQVRQAPQDCPYTAQIGLCYPEYSYPAGGSQESFGWNYSHPGSSMDQPFTYMTPEDAGGNPDGFVSAPRRRSLLGGDPHRNPLSFLWLVRRRPSPQPPPPPVA